MLIFTISLKLLIIIFLEKCSFSWVTATQETIPKEAYVGGYDVNGEPFNICRHRVNFELVAGKADKQLGCVLTFSGKEVYATEIFEVLVANNVEWVPRHGSDPMTEHAIVVGTKFDGLNTYVGRCFNHNSQLVGKIDGVFYYGFSGLEWYDCVNHEVLICYSD